MFGSNFWRWEGYWGHRLTCWHGVLLDWAWGLMNMLESRLGEGISVPGCHVCQGTRSRVLAGWAGFQATLPEDWAGEPMCLTAVD